MIELSHRQNEPHCWLTAIDPRHPPPEFPLAGMDYHPRLRPVGKAIHPGEVEIRANPRARSAVLRVAERLQ